MIRDDLDASLAPGQRLSYAGRPRSASTAVGYKQLHDREQATLIQAALGAHAKVEQTPVKKEATPQS